MGMRTQTKFYGAVDEWILSSSQGLVPSLYIPTLITLNDLCSVHCLQFNSQLHINKYIKCIINKTNFTVASSNILLPDVEFCIKTTI